MTARQFFPEWALDNTNSLPIKSFDFAEAFAKSERDDILARLNEAFADGLPSEMPDTQIIDGKHYINVDEAIKIVSEQTKK